jgi:hypothetical protein
MTENHSTGHREPGSGCRIEKTTGEIETTERLAHRRGMALRDRRIDLRRHKEEPHHLARTDRPRTQHGRITVHRGIRETAMIASNADNRVIAQDNLRTARHPRTRMARSLTERIEYTEKKRPLIERTGRLTEGEKCLTSRTGHLHTEKERTRAKPRRLIPTRRVTTEVTYDSRIRHRKCIRGTIDHMVNSDAITRKEERLVSADKVYP